MLKKIIFTLILVMCSFVLYAQIQDPWNNPTMYFGGTTFSVKVQVNGVNASENDLLIAYVDNQVRCKTTLSGYPAHIGGVGKTFMIQSNTSGETTHFKLWRYSEQAIYETTYTLTSNPGGTVGTGTNPVVVNFNIRKNTISGHVTELGVGIENVIINISNVNPAISTFLYKQPFKTNNQGYYIIPDISTGASILFSAYSPTHTLNPPTHSFNNVQNHLTANFSADPLPVYHVSGYITTAQGNPVSGVSIGNTTTDLNGFYTLPVVQNHTITLTPLKNSFTFLPPTVTHSSVQNHITQNFTAVEQFYSITGNAGLENVQINIQSNNTSLPASVFTDQNGDYVLSGISWSNNVTLTPQKTGYNFNPAMRTFNNIQEDKVQNFSPSIIQFTVSGVITLSGTGLEGVGIFSENVLLSTTNNTGFYSFNVNYGQDILFTPNKPGYTFIPPSGSFFDVQENKVQNFEAQPIPQYTVSGTVTFNGNPLEGVNLNFGVYGDAVSNASGEYSKTVYETGETVLIIPSKPGYVFTPGQIVLQGVNGHLSNQNFSSAIQTFSVSGNTGISNVSIAINSARFPSQVISDINGNYVVPDIPYGSNFTLTPSKPGYTFSPQTISINNINSDLINQSFSPNQIQFTITVSVVDFNNNPIQGVSVNYNSQTGLTNSNGIFIFQENWGSSFTITIHKSGHFFNNQSHIISNLQNNENVTFVSRAPYVYILNGNVSDTAGQGVSGVNVQINERNTHTDANGDYQANIFEGENISIIPSKTGYTFENSMESINNVNGNVTRNFTATLNQYVINGYVLLDSQGLSNVSISYNSQSILTDNSGFFEFTASHGQSLNIVPAFIGYTFNPPSINISNIQSGMTNLIFNALPNEHFIHGTILAQGLPLSGVTVKDMNSERQVLTNANGQYTFPVFYGENILLKPFKDWHYFNPETISYPFVNNNYPNANFMATPYCGDVIFSPEPGLYYEPIYISMESPTPGVEIRYTTNGANPSPTSLLYTEPIFLDISSSLNLKARAYKSGYQSSVISLGGFIVTGTIDDPVLVLQEGEYFEAKTLEIMTYDPEALVYYTLDSSEPTTDAFLYTQPIVLSVNTIVTAKSFKDDYLPSQSVSAVYLITHLLDFDLPDEVIINENQQITLNFKNYIFDSVYGDFDYLITGLSNSQSISTDISNNYVTFIPSDGWFGEEWLKFQVDFENVVLPVRLSASTAIDSIKIIVNQLNPPPQIINYHPVQDTITINHTGAVNFYINVTHQGGNVNYQWFINDDNQNHNDNNILVNFNQSGEFLVRVRAYNQHNYSEKIWTVLSNVSIGEEVAEFYQNRLYPNYPNPFNPRTKIKFSLENENDVNISVYNLKGQLIKELLNQRYSKGLYEIVWNAEKLSSGIYLIKMQTGNFAEIKKAVILK